MSLESVLVGLSLLAGLKLYHWNSPRPFELSTAWPGFTLQALLIVGIFQVCFFYNNLYQLNGGRRRSEQLVRLCESLGAACLLLALLDYLLPALALSRGVFVITVALVAGCAALMRLSMDTGLWARALSQNVLILGTGELASTLSIELARRADLSVSLVGFVSGAGEGAESEELVGGRILGSTDDLETIACQHRVSRIIVAIEDRRGSLPVQALVKLRVRGVKVEDAPSALAGLSGRVWLSTVRPSWFVFSDGFHRSKAVAVGKRAIDLFFGLAGLILSAPVMALVAVAVRLDSPGPILYRQRRMGFGGRLFEVLKFRSMREDAEDQNGAQWAEEDDPRVTRVGRFIRTYRLDELPQYLNVVCGEMSFVGPRPERPEFVDILRQQIPYYDERHSVRPGITGWAQVQYPYAASVEDSYRKLEYDLFYLKNMSVLLDVVIVVRTVGIVLFGRGSR